MKIRGASETCNSELVRTKARIPGAARPAEGSSWAGEACRGPRRVPRLAGTLGPSVGRGTRAQHYPSPTLGPRRTSGSVSGVGVCGVAAEVPAPLPREGELRAPPPWSPGEKESRSLEGPGVRVGGDLRAPCGCVPDLSRRHPAPRSRCRVNAPPVGAPPAPLVPSLRGSGTTTRAPSGRGAPPAAPDPAGRGRPCTRSPAPPRRRSALRPSRTAAWA